MSEEVEILSDGSRVWVNDSQGGCIGRFSKAGIDIHRTVEEQISSGTQCLACKPGSRDWDAFVGGMMEHHGVNIGQEHRPSWSKLTCDEFPCAAELSCYNGHRPE